MSGLQTELRTPRASSNALSPRPQWLCLSILACALGYAVFAHGARALLDWNISLSIIGVGVVVYWAMTARSDAATAPENMETRLGTLALLVPAWVVFQLVPLPIFLVKILSPERGRILESLRAVMPLGAFAPLTISPATTSAHLFRIIGYVLVFFLVREVASRSREPWVVAIPLIGIAGLEAVFGFIQNANGAAVEGTYWNKNHFAGLLEMVLPIAIACAIALLGGGRSRRGGAGVGRALSACVVLVSAIAMLGALIYSLSKMGFVAGLGGLLFMAAVALATSVTGRKKWWCLALLAVFFLSVFVFVPPDQLAGAFASSSSDQTGEGRLPIWSDSLRLLAAYPVTGSGLGTYDTAFLKYQTALVDVDFNFAHNDYLEFAAELGALGFLILAGFALAIFSKTLRAGSRLFDPSSRYLAWGCAGAIVAIGLHSFTDFNLYIPANALVLAWIFGIVASFPPRSTAPAPNRTPLRHVQYRSMAIALGCLVLIYAPAWILLEGKFLGNPQVEMRFCTFGVCDTEALVASETAAHGGSVAAVPVPELLNALQRDSASPHRWCDLGEAFLRTGGAEQARYCFSNALALGPNIPPVQLRVAGFYSTIHRRKRELEQTTAILEKSSSFDDPVFDRYRQEKIPMAEILSSGLPQSPRAPQSWLRYLMRSYDFADAGIVWNWLLSRHYGDDSLARNYVNFLYSDRRYESAAEAWAQYLGDRRKGYLESNWLYNGDFESESSGINFDWRMESPDDDVKVALDPSVAHTGSHSLRIQFGGKENVDYSQTSQTVL